MEKIELLEKLVEVQEQHIALMYDYYNLQGSLKSLEEVKNRRINYFDDTLEEQSEEIGAQAENNEALEVKNAELKKQIEILQQSIISIETPEEK